MIFGVLFVGADVMFSFEVEQFHIDIIEMMIGSTVIAGTANAGFKRYVKSKGDGSLNNLKTLIPEIKKIVQELDTTNKEKT